MRFASRTSPNAVEGEILLEVEPVGPGVAWELGTRSPNF